MKSPSEKVETRNHRNWLFGQFPHLLVGDLQQVQHDSVGPHVLQQPLLLHTTLLTGITQLTEPK